MKRFILTALVALAVVGYASPSQAAWTIQQLKWSHPSFRPATVVVASSPSNGYVRDTTWIPLAASKVDTTTEFSLLDCDLQDNKGTADSVVVAHVVITGDSTVASSINFKNTTVALQTNFGDNAGGWQTAQTFSLLYTDGQKALSVPIFNHQVATGDLPIDLTTGQGTILAPRCRLIVTGGSSVACPMAKVMVKKYLRNVPHAGVEFVQTSQ